MKHIIKGEPPHELIAWTHEKTIGKSDYETSWSYDDMPATVREAVRRSLIWEQGALCCYTGRRISINSSHIEHLKPQAFCKDHEDTDYGNLLAAYPATRVTEECEYGAHYKHNWYEPRLFVHPLRTDCESRITYGFNGKAVPHNATDDAANATIKTLNLNHKQLVEMRNVAIDEALFTEKPSVNKVRRLIAAMDERNSSGEFRPFCFAIKQACKKYLVRNE